MKLKEQLAKDYARVPKLEAVELNNIPDKLSTYSKGKEEGFLAGFDAAKKLLRDMEPFKGRSWFEIPMEDLDNLGEEEEIEYSQG